jgi:hypothetical protein
MARGAKASFATPITPSFAVISGFPLAEDSAKSMVCELAIVDSEAEQGVRHGHR